MDPEKVMRNKANQTERIKSTLKQMKEGKIKT